MLSAGDAHIYIKDTDPERYSTITYVQAPLVQFLLVLIFDQPINTITFGCAVAEGLNAYLLIIFLVLVLDS